MENPEAEIKDVIRGLVRKPTFARQEAVLRRYYAPDCTFYHFLINIECGGVDNLIAMYNIGELLVNYQDVDFYNIGYDADKQLLTVRMGVHVRPPVKLFTSATLNLLVLLELEDFQAEDGRILKRVRVQRDYFNRSPALLCLPIVGDIYASDTLRSWLGFANALVFRSFKNMIHSFS